LWQPKKGSTNGLAQYQKSPSRNRNFKPKPKKTPPKNATHYLVMTQSCNVGERGVAEAGYEVVWQEILGSVCMCVCVKKCGIIFQARLFT